MEAWTKVTFVLWSEMPGSILKNWKGMHRAHAACRCLKGDWRKFKPDPRVENLWSYARLTQFIAGLWEIALEGRRGQIIRSWHKYKILYIEKCVKIYVFKGTNYALGRSHELILVGFRSSLGDGKYIFLCTSPKSVWSEIWSQWDQFVEGSERNFTPKFRRSSELRWSRWSESFRGGIKSYHTKVQKCTNALKLCWNVVQQENVPDMQGDHVL